MVDKLPAAANSEAETPAALATKKVYHRPSLTKLGSLRDMTMTVGGSGAADGGMIGKTTLYTKRGGNFEAASFGS